MNIDTWYQDWSKTEAAIFAMSKFKEITGADINVNHSIIIACFNAAHYDAELDPGALYRKEMQEEKHRKKDLLKAVRVLARNAKLDSTALKWADMFADAASGVRITRRVRDGEDKANHLVMYDYFSQLEIALEGDLPEINGGPFLNKFTIGNLIFDKPIGAGPPIAVETLLAFELAFYMRMHTAKCDGRQNAQHMPEYGDPCFGAVAAFCFATFPHNGDKQTGDENRTGEAVRNLIRRGTGLATQWIGVNTG